MAKPVKPVPRTIQWTPEDSWVQKIFKLNLSDKHKRFYVEEFLNKVNYFLDKKQYEKQQKYIVQRNEVEKYLKKTWGETIAAKIEDKLIKYFDRLDNRILAAEQAAAKEKQKLAPTN